jgi:hypothetical protein
MSEKKRCVSIFNNILFTHHTNVFGGKPTLWDILKDVVGNLNQKKEGYK